MHWKTAVLCALALVGTLVCPHAFGKGGTLDRATSKDMREQFGTKRCNEEQLLLYCGEGSDADECADRCG